MKWIAPLMKLPYSPLISVVMSVYNAPLEMVKLSINCVLNQTIKDIEFIIVDDNNSIEVIGYLKKDRPGRLKDLCNSQLKKYRLD